MMFRMGSWSRPKIWRFTATYTRRRGKSDTTQITKPEFRENLARSLSNRSHSWGCCDWKFIDFARERALTARNLSAHHSQRGQGASQDAQQDRPQVEILNLCS
jgi:hypothetical protein